MGRMQCAWQLKWRVSALPTGVRTARLAAPHRDGTGLVGVWRPRAQTLVYVQLNVGAELAATRSGQNARMRYWVRIGTSRGRYPRLRAVKCCSRLALPSATIHHY